ncbi:MAG: hypothetical protein V9F01_00675 [Chitinophagaceae bacterium]
MDWLLLILFGIGAIALIIFLVIRNRKDESRFTKQLNNHYRKSKDEENDTEIDEVVK